MKKNLPYLLALALIILTSGVTVVDLSFQVKNTLAGANGGTGVANTGKTITVAGNTTIGSSTHTMDIATSGNTSVTFPTSGTLATLTGTETFTNKTIDWDDNTMQDVRDVIIIACSDLTTDVTTGTTKAYFRMPYAATLTSVRASVGTAGTASTLTIDINEAGSTILSTKLTIDASEKTSTTAATAAVISDASLADDAEITIDFDAVPTGAKWVLVKLYVKHN